MKELRFDFTEKPVSREDFLINVKEKLIPFVGTDIYAWNIFMMYIVEMIKNIYDHAGGIGYAYFKKDMHTIEFDIKDFGRNTFDYEEMKAIGKSTAGTTYNRGIGLSIIESLDQQLETELRIDQTDGLRYSGSWNYNR